jgi:glycine/D-amino acid oxidase-like deaminating enzyme
MASRTRCQVAGGIRREAGRSAPVVVNCSGLGARELAGEFDLRPVFGQHVVVTNPGLDALFIRFCPAPDKYLSGSRDATPRANPGDCRVLAAPGIHAFRASRPGVGAAVAGAPAGAKAARPPGPNQ